MAQRFSILTRALTRAQIRKLKSGEKLAEHGIATERLSDGDLRFSINIMVDGTRIHRVVGRESLDQFLYCSAGRPSPGFWSISHCAFSGSTRWSGSIAVAGSKFYWWRPVPGWSLPSLSRPACCSPSCCRSCTAFTSSPDPIASSWHGCRGAPCGMKLEYWSSHRPHPSISQMPNVFVQ